MLYQFTYAGVVESNRDPLKLGRVKARVPHVYGSSVTGAGYVGINDLPWALPAGMPAGGSSASGGFSQLPSVGDKVWVRFLDGEPEKPIWEWGMQSIPDSASLKLHEYAEGTPVGEPDRAIVSRYGNSLEITENTVILTTKQGYQIVLDNSTGSTGGSTSLLTPAGQKIALNDLSKTILIQGLDSAVLSATGVIMNAATSALIKAGKNLTVMIGGTLLTIQEKSVVLATGTGATVIIDADGNISMVSAGGSTVSLEDNKLQLASPSGTSITLEDGKTSINSENIIVNTSAMAVGTDAVYPVFMTTPSLLSWIALMSTHTHISATPGSPTTTPVPLPSAVVPTFPQDSTSTRMSTT